MLAKHPAKVEAIRDMPVSVGFATQPGHAGASKNRIFIVVPSATHADLPGSHTCRRGRPARPDRRDPRRSDRGVLVWPGRHDRCRYRFAVGVAQTASAVSRRQGHDNAPSPAAAPSVRHPVAYTDGNPVSGVLSTSAVSLNARTLSLSSTNCCRSPHKASHQNTSNSYARSPDPPHRPARLPARRT